jgi:hypothetical protein
VSHFPFSCDDSLNTIFLKYLNVALFRFSSNSWFARGRCGYKKDKGKKKICEVIKTMATKQTNGCH